MAKSFIYRGGVLCALLAGVLMVAACSAANPTSNEPSGSQKIATFDGGDVTQDELQEGVDLFAQQSGSETVSPDSPQYQSVVQQVLPQLVQSEIAKAYASENGITITDKDVDREIDTLKQQVAQQAQATGQDLSPDEAFNQALKQADLSESDLRDEIREQLPAQKVQQRVAGDAKATDSEVRDFYDQNKEQFAVPEQRCVRHILLGPDQEQKARDDYQKLQDGADFADLAKQDSQDPGSAKKGGDLGCISEGETVPNFEDAAFKAKKGETVGPVETKFGYHIIRVYDIKEKSEQPLSDVGAQIRQQITAQKQGEEFSSWLQKQEKQRDVKYLSGYGPNASEASTQENTTQ